MKNLIPRKFERKRFVGEAVLRALPDGPALKVQVLDLGQSGLALFSVGCLPKGQLIEMKFPLRSAAAQAGLEKRLGRIVRNRTHPDGNVLGVAFDLPLETDEIKLLEADWIRS